MFAQLVLILGPGLFSPLVPVAVAESHGSPVDLVYTSPQSKPTP